MAKKGQKFNKYPKDLIDEILKEYFENNKSTPQLAKEYSIPRGSIENWVLKVNRPDLFPGLGMKRGKPSNKDTNWKERYEILKKYRAFLKAQRERK